MVHVMVLAAAELGVLRRICGVYESRRYRVRSLTAGPADRPGFLRVNLALDEPAERARRLAAQLARLVDVAGVEVVEAGRAVARELALVKVLLAGPGQRPDVLQVAQVFRARVVDVGPRSLVLELTGDSTKVDAFIRLVEEFGPVEVVRTGVAAIGRGEGVLPGTAVAPRFHHPGHAGPARDPAPGAAGAGGFGPASTAAVTGTAAAVAASAGGATAVAPPAPATAAAGPRSSHAGVPRA
mgnify:CR=1 FL=1